MKTISDSEILHRVQLENPWWQTKSISERWRDMKRRAYLLKFLELLRNSDPVRALVLMGPRRVGKSVLIHHAIQDLLDKGIPAADICYISIDAPVYTGLSLVSLLKHYAKAVGRASFDGAFIFFDEIQYLPEWERHLKKLVEDYPKAKFIASGSAAAALRLKSNESGAGRFTDFQLPPLTFHEFLLLSGKEGAVKELASWPWHTTSDLAALNADFIDYLNYGGYPEAITSAEIRSNPERFIKSDIIEKVLLRDLPSLYGIAEIQELNRLFTMLAYNSGHEVSLDALSQGSGVAKNTIKRYLEYLKAAFLIQELHRVDDGMKFFKRANFFKVYLTNPSMRAALFGPISAGHEFAGHLAETAAISQISHFDGWENIHYARWSKGEVDLIQSEGSKPFACAEIKWSNRWHENEDEVAPLIYFMRKNGLHRGVVTTLDVSDAKDIRGVRVEFVPCSLFCYGVGRRAVQFRTALT